MRAHLNCRQAAFEPLRLWCPWQDLTSPTIFVQTMNLVPVCHILTLYEIYQYVQTRFKIIFFEYFSFWNCESNFFLWDQTTIRRSNFPPVSRPWSFGWHLIIRSDINFRFFLNSMTPFTNFWTGKNLHGSAFCLHANRTENAKILFNDTEGSK